MTRVLLVMMLSSLDSSRSAGGLDTACQTHLAGIIRHGCSKIEYSVVAFSQFDDFPMAGKTIRMADNVNVSLHNFHQKTHGVNSFLPSFISRERIVRKAARAFKPVIIHTHIPTSPLQRCAARVKFVTMHSWGKIGRSTNGLMNDVVYERLLQPLSLWSTDIISTVSNEIEQSLARRWFGASGGVWYVPNPISEHFFLSSSECKKSRRPIILVSGAVQEKKGSLHCVAAFSKLLEYWPDAELHFAGPFDARSAYFGGLMDVIVRGGLQDRVTFLGSLDTVSLLSELDKCWCLLSMSHEETFGLAPLEAIARGTPAVSTRVGVFKSKEADMCNLGVEIVDVGDVEAAASHMNVIIAGRGRTVDQYALQSMLSVRAQISQFESLYALAIAEKRL